MKGLFSIVTRAIFDNVPLNMTRSKKDSIYRSDTVFFERVILSEKDRKEPKFTFGNRPTNKTSGFTLVEMLVVVGVTALLTAISASYNLSGKDQIALFRDQAVVSGVLNRARSLAIQKYREKSLVQNVETCGFGVYVSETGKALTLFQDIGVGGCGTTNNYKYDEGANPSEKLETLTLNPRVEFINVPVGGLSVMFVPPELSVRSNSGSFPVVITLKTIKEGMTSTITISAAGQIMTN